MLTISNLSVHFRGAAEPLFSDVSFIVNNGERVGLVGPNGAGKSTLLHVVLGQHTANRGSVQFSPPDARVGYLSQGIALDATVGDVLFPHRQQLYAAEDRLETIAMRMADADETELLHLTQQYEDALAVIEQLGVLEEDGRAERILADLSLAHLEPAMPVTMLSGGQKTRLRVASVLLKDPQLLLLDEPTNHLDIAAIEWLEDWLHEFHGAVLMVSHDRVFLDRTVSQIVALDKGSARVYPGNYRDYVAAVQSEQEKQWAQWQDQQVEIARMQADISFTMAKAVNRENATKNDQQRRYAKKVAKRAQSKVTRLNRYLASEDRVEKPQQTWNLKLDFADLPRTGQDVVIAEGLAIGYDEPLLTDVNLNVRPGERIVVMGPNGQGKSTLLKTIIGELEPLAGTVRLGASIKVGYLAQEQDIFDEDDTPLSVIQSVSTMNHTETRSFLHFFLFAGDDALRPVEALSFGERARLMLARLVALGSNLLVLDEPINHLDVQSREQFEAALENFGGSIIAVVHDRYFVERFATTTWHVEDHTLKIGVERTILERD